MSSQTVVLLDGTSEVKEIFTCPHCSGRFKAAVSNRPKAYKCPNCRKIITILDDMTVEPGDHAKEPGQEAIDGSLDMIESISSGHDEERTNDGSAAPAEEEKRLFSEIMERMKEIRSKQERTVTDRSGEELQTLKEENSLLKARISSLMDELKKARSFALKGYAEASGGDPGVQIMELKERIQNQAEIISKLTQRNERYEAMMGNGPFGSDRNKDDTQHPQIIDHHGKGMDLDERERALEKREEELNALAEQIEKEKDVLEEFRKELYLYQGKLENKAVSLSSERDEMDKIKNEYAHVQDLALELKNRERELDEREYGLNEMENDITITMLNQKQTEKLASAVKEREMALSLREKDLKDKETALRSSLVKWKDFAQQLENYRKSLAGTSEELMKRDRNLLIQERKLEKARDKLKTLKTMILNGTLVQGDPSAKADMDEAFVKGKENMKTGSDPDNGKKRKI